MELGGDASGVVASFIVHEDHIHNIPGSTMMTVALKYRGEITRSSGYSHSPWWIAGYWKSDAVNFRQWVDENISA